MPKKVRQDAILDILQKQGFVTVKELTALLDYSSATINRDLNEMEKRGLAKRSYGGVEAAITKLYLPLPGRYDWQRKVKMHLAKVAAEHIKDGDTVFIDAGTTTSYIGTYLADKKDVHVITNNIQLAQQLSQGNCKVTVLGGLVRESPCMLAGDETVENIWRYHADKMFFTSIAFASDGRISGGTAHHLIHRAMMECSKKVYYLANAQKCREDFNINVCTFSRVDGVISDYVFPDEIKEKYPKTEFLKIEL